MSLIFSDNVNLDYTPPRGFVDQNIEVTLDDYENVESTYSWVVTKPDGSTFTDPYFDNRETFSFRPVDLGFQAGQYTIEIRFDDDENTTNIPIFDVIEIIERTDSSEPEIIRTFAPFISEITSVDDNIIGIRKNNWELNKYNFDLRVFEERYNMINIVGGRIGLLSAR